MSRPRPDTEQLAAQAQVTIDLLQAVQNDRGVLAYLDDAQREQLLTLAGQISRPMKHERKALARERQRIDRDDRRASDEAVLNKTGIRKLRENPIFLTPRWRGLRDERLGLLEDGTTAPTVSVATASPTIPDGAPLPGEATPPPVGTVSDERICYCCRATFTDVHHFYDQMCHACGDLNYAKRFQQADLRGRVALVTGARVKIGYQAAILLLRSGCRVIVLTRFPRDAARRYAAEPDFGDWGHRLQIHGLDLRHTPSVEALCEHLLQTLERLDYVINNACQTVRRPSGFYDHMMEVELSADPQLSSAELGLLGTSYAADPDRPDGTGLSILEPGAPLPRALGAVPGVLPSAALSQVPILAEDEGRDETLFPVGHLDADEQQVDLRRINSWRLKLADVPTMELLEVQLVNAIAPFVLNARLKPLMQRVPTRDTHIVNVSAMEGQFYRLFKTDRHPHTNMAKAALNMMTRTSAIDYVEDGIHMNSVDTGWVTDEDPLEHAVAKREVHRFHPPLDIVDGAARIVDPIFDGANTGEHVWGQFLKDYKPTDW